MEWSLLKRSLSQPLQKEEEEIHSDIHLFSIPLHFDTKSCVGVEKG